MTTSRRSQWCRYVIASAITAFATNWIWEMAQMFAYRDLASQAWRETVGMCTFASIGDVLLTFLAYTLGAAVWRDWRWGWSGTAKFHMTLAGFGLVLAVAVEFFALRRGEWAYNDHMPVVPGIEVGLLPLLQLTLLIPLAFVIGNKVRRVSLED